jgi:CheY-like chemotaxis protein
MLTTRQVHQMVDKESLLRDNRFMVHEDRHILIIEDSPELQLLTARLFQSEGYKLSQAYNGREALSLLHSMDRLPSLILLDIMMPVMDGIEFLEEIKKDPVLAAIPIVVMSADANSRANVAKITSAPFIQKPIHDIEQLLGVIEDLR